MPFPIIQTVLGAGFAFIWILIAVIVIRDGQLAVRRDRETDDSGTSAVRPQIQKLPPRLPHGHRVASAA